MVRRQFPGQADHRAAQLPASDMERDDSTAALGFDHRISGSSAAVRRAA
jgi:hypothetical protein